MNRLQSQLEKIGRNPKTTAKSVGLRYAADFTKGYYRLKQNNTFIYIDENKKKVKNKLVLNRIKSLVVPPAWENVWISPFENGHLQAIGIDSKGRKQYRYHPDWNRIRNQSKFYRLRSFANALPLIRKQVEIDMNRKGLPYEKVMALVVKLIEMTNIRIRNEAYKKLYGSFGLTKLQDKHVKFENSKIHFKFVGKKGVKHSISLQSKKLADLVKKCKEIPGQDLFQYFDEEGRHYTIGSSDINNYLKEITQQDFTAKDFRVWAGSVLALCYFLQCEKHENQTECKPKIIEMLDHVASNLGNTRAVCKKYYVHPTVIKAYENGNIWNYKAKKGSSRLEPEEKALVQLLENEVIAEVAG